MAADQVGGSQAGAKECDEVDRQLVAVGDVEGQVLKLFCKKNHKHITLH